MQKLLGLSVALALVAPAVAQDPYQNNPYQQGAVSQNPPSVPPTSGHRTNPYQQSDTGNVGGGNYTNPQGMSDSQPQHHVHPGALSDQGMSDPWAGNNPWQPSNPWQPNNPWQPSNNGSSGNTQWVPDGNGGWIQVTVNKPVPQWPPNNQPPYWPPGDVPSSPAGFSLGITFQEEGRGTRVTSVTPGSAAARVGIESGDIITAIDGIRLDGSNPLPRAISLSDGFVRVTLIDIRTGRFVERQVSLDRR